MAATWPKTRSLIRSSRRKSRRIRPRSDISLPARSAIRGCPCWRCGLASHSLLFLLLPLLRRLPFHQRDELTDALLHFRRRGDGERIPFNLGFHHGRLEVLLKELAQRLRLRGVQVVSGSAQRHLHRLPRRLIYHKQVDDCIIRDGGESKT